MKPQDFPRLMLAGLAATTVMTVALFPVSAMLDTSAFDFAGVLGSVFAGSALVGSTAWWLGLAEHFFNGAILFPAIYGFILYKILPGETVMKGLVWGIALFIGWQAVVLPFTDLGLFSKNSNQTELLLFMSFNGHLMYGLVFGGFAGRPKAVMASNVTAPAPRDVLHDHYAKTG